MPPKSTPQRPALSPARKKPSVLDDLGETFDDFLKDEETASAAASTAASTATVPSSPSTHKSASKKKRDKKKRAKAQAQAVASTGHAGLPPPAESTDDSDGSTSIASASGGSGQQWLRKKNTEPVAEEDTAPIPEIAEAPAVVTPAVVAEHSVAPAVVLAPAPSTAQSMAQTSAPVAATAYDSEEFEALSASASHANLGVEELEQPPVAEQGPPSIAADLVVLAPEAPMDTSNILDNEPSLDLSFRTDDDKRDFFARVESVANDGAIDYAALNRALPDDSVDVGGMSMRDVIGAAPDAAIHSSFPAFGEPSAAPAAVTEAIAPTSSTSDHSSKGSSRLDLDEEHTEDLASIQSNIDFIERSHVFQESGEDGTSSMAEVSIRESPKKQKPPARPSPPSSRASVSARSSALDRLNKKIATSAGARTKTAPKSNSNSSSATTSLVDLSMASAASVQEYDQRNREANFLQQLLDQEQSKGQALKSQVESLTATVARLTADNTVLIAETEDFRKLLSDRDATIKHAREKESAASDGKSATRATNDYQEQLLRGFQQENDKLVAEIAEWKKRVAEAKAEAARDHQQLHDEILELRTALKEKPGRESVMSRHRDDEYESRLEALTKQHRDAELELKITVDEWRVRYETAMREPLAQARLKAEQEVNAMKAQLDGEVRRLRQELAAFKEREEARATEPDHAAEAEALRHTVDSLRAELEAERGAHANALHDKELALIQAGQTADDAVSKLKRETLALVELRKTVAEYKQRIVDMEKRLEKERPNPIADLIRATKPSAEEQLLVDELRAKVATLEGDNQALHDDMTRRLRSLRAEHDAMVQDYERRVQALQATVAQAEEQRDAAERQKTSGAAPVRDLPLPMTVSSTSSHNNETNAILREVIQSLRDELRQRANDEMKLRREADDYRLKYANSHAELQQQSALARQLESNLRQLRENLDAVNRKLSESGRAKAGGDAAANEQVVKLLQEEINTLTKRVAELQHKLDANEAVRQSMHDNFLLILRQTQEETSRSSMDHHERALRILREENRASASQLIAEETKRWREQLMDYESEVAHWKVRAEELEAQLRDAQLRLRDGRERQRGGRTPAKVDADLEDELAYAEGMPSDKENSGRPFDKENSGRRSRSQSRGYAAVPDHFTGASDNAELTALRNEVALLQSTQSPDAAQLQALLQKITTMEARFDRRDHAWRQLLARQRDETRDATERERQRYKAALKKKEAEVKRFRGEMDVVMRELEQLRK